MNKPNQKFVMQTAALEVSIQENIDLKDLAVRESSKTPGKWAIVQISTKKVWFVKNF